MGLLPSSSLDDFSGLETDTAPPTEEDYVVYDDGMETISLCFLITRSYFSYKTFFFYVLLHTASTWQWQAVT
jgi:hypothetical protein